MAPSITLDDYRFGVIIGASAAWGLNSLLESLEVLVFGGLLIPWTQRLALIGLLGGLAHVGLSVYLHRWVRSLQNIAETEREATNG